MSKTLRQKLKIRKDRNTVFYTTLDYYMYYIENTEKNYHISRNKYRKVLEEYWKYLSDKLLRGEEIDLFNRMGSVVIIKFRPKDYTKKSLSIDFKSTKELGKTIYYLNEHSNGFKFRLYWKKGSAYFHNKTKYRMSLTRTNKRALAQIIKNREQDFIEN